MESFNARSVAISELGNDLTFRVGDMSRPAASFDAILPLVRIGEVRSIHIISGAHNMSLDDVHGLIVVNSGTGRIGTARIELCSNVTLIDVQVVDEFEIEGSNNIRIRRCILSHVECMDCSMIDIEDSKFLDTRANVVIILRYSRDVSVQGNIIVTSITGPILNVSNSTDVTFRDNIVRAINLTSVISNTSSNGVSIDHNCFITSSQDVSLQCSYTSRRVLVSNDGTSVHLDNGSPSVVLVESPADVILPSSGVTDGTVIEIISLTSSTITGDILTMNPTVNRISLNIPANASVRAQYVSNEGRWSISLWLID
uniref:Right handed beta helix domain-containing protein n=1 Tax=viral metagenome TaxID=1070528 RepID=A0A6C0BM16_9ZZZZ